MGHAALDPLAKPFRQAAFATHPVLPVNKARGRLSGGTMGEVLTLASVSNPGLVLLG